MDQLAAAVLYSHFNQYDALITRFNNFHYLNLLKTGAYSPYTAAAQSELNDLQNQLSSTNLVQGVADTITCNRHSSQAFSTSSAYKFMGMTPHIRTDLHKIWTIDTPPRVTIFLWLLNQKQTSHH
jgi:hypothetical protein